MEKNQVLPVGVCRIARITIVTGSVAGGIGFKEAAQTPRDLIGRTLQCHPFTTTSGQFHGEAVAIGIALDSIYSQLLLSCDLKGYIYNAAYYFSGDADSVKRHLDLVMMTNGWRRFKWTDVLTGNWPLIKSIPENKLFIKGKILGLSKSLLFQKELTGILKTKNGASNIFTMPVNSQGEFSQDGLYFFDTAKLHYQLNNDKDKTLTTSASFAFQTNFIKAPLQSIVLLSGLYSPEKTDSLDKSALVVFI